MGQVVHSVIAPEASSATKKILCGNWLNSKRGTQLPSPGVRMRKIAMWSIQPNPSSYTNGRQQSCGSWWVINVHHRRVCKCAKTYTAAKVAACLTWNFYPLQTTHSHHMDRQVWSRKHRSTPWCGRVVTFSRCRAVTTCSFVS